MAELRFTILGCGSSAGVPRIGGAGGDWGACDPANPKNRRRRCALLVERVTDSGRTIALVDTGPDCREQLIGAGVGRLDGVLYTHPHADHIHGIDELRAVALNERRRVPVYVDTVTSQRLHEAFGYCFVTPVGSSYPPILEEHRIAPGTPVTINGPGGPIEAVPFRQIHGDIDALGFRFDGLAYSSDLNGLPPESEAILAGLDIWIVDALRYRPHPSHFTVDDALRWIERLAPRRAVLTNMHIDLDYETLKAELPDGVEPAYDGMTITLAAMTAEGSPRASDVKVSG